MRGRARRRRPSGLLARLDDGETRRRSRPALESPRGLADGVDNADVAGTPADVARQVVADLLLGGIGVLLEQRLRRKQQSGRAEAALQTLLVVVGLLNGVQ